MTQASGFLQGLANSISNTRARVPTTLKKAARRVQGVISNAKTPSPKVISYEKAVNRLDISKLCQERLKVTPRDFQLQAAEAILTGKDCVLNIPTGGGKTLAFFLPSLLKPQSTTLVISPLTALMMDQVHTMNGYNIPAVAGCRETLGKDSSLFKNIASGKVPLVFVSPEIATSKRFLEEVLQEPSYGSKLLCLVIDEAHCVSEWGGSFRPEYTQLGLLRGRIRPGLPVLIASATLPLEINKDVREKLRISPTAITIEMSNNRPNVALSVRPILHADVGADIAFMIPPKIKSAREIEQQLAYFNSRTEAEDAVDTLREVVVKLGIDPDCIAFYHARVGEARKRELEAKYKSGEIRILCCTDAVGMGCDMRGVKKVILWKAPPTFCALAQRSGRAAHDLSSLGEAVLFVPQRVLNGKEKLEIPEEVVEEIDLLPAEGDDMEVGEATATETREVDDQDSAAISVRAPSRAPHLTSQITWPN